MVQPFDRRKKTREELSSAKMRAEKRNYSLNNVDRKRPGSAAKVIENNPGLPVK